MSPTPCHLDQITQITSLWVSSFQRKSLEEEPMLVFAPPPLPFATIRHKTQHNPINCNNIRIASHVDNVPLRS